MSDYNCWSGVIKDMDDLKAEIQKLQEENKLLRECVEFYADPLTYTYDKRIQDVPIDAFGSKKARKTLERLRLDDSKSLKIKGDK